MADLGHDLSCVDDLDPLMVEVDGRRCLGEAIARRLTTPRRGLLGDPDYGFDLRLVNDDLGPRDLAMLQSGIVAECLKDERVVRAQASVTLAAGRLVVDLTLVDSAGPFKLLLVVSSVAIELLRVAT